MNELLHKYWEGRSSLEEEQQLRDYFNSDEVATEHEVYRSIFNTFEEEHATEMNLDFDAFAKVTPEEKPVDRSKIKVLKGLAIAAGFAIIMALGSNYMDKTDAQPDLGTYDDPQEAYQATVDALHLIGTKFNNGRENLKPLQEINNKKHKVFNLSEEPLKSTVKVSKK